MDSQGNICGTVNKEITITNAKGVEEKRTNAFAVELSTDGVWSGGKAPKDLVKAKFGVFPRLASDVVAQLDKFATDPTSLKFTQMCVDECPSAGDVVCSYFFLSRWNDVIKNTANPVNSSAVRMYMRVTSGVNREMATGAPFLLENECKIYGKKGDTEYDMCIDSFIHCDFVPTNSNPILGRCMPYIDTSPEVKTQRCIEPLTVKPCDPSNETTWAASGSDSDFNTECLLNTDTGTYVAPQYVPVKVVKKGITSYMLSKEANKYCVRAEEKKLQVTEVIPQMEYLSALTSVAGTIAQYMGDIRTAWIPVLASGLAFPLVFSFVYTLIMRFCAGCMVWLALLLFILLTIALAVVALLKGGAVDIALVDNVASAAGQASASSYSFTSISQDYGIYYQVIGYSLLAFALITICMCIFMRKAIQSAIHIIRTAAKALAQNFSLTLFPVITFMGIAATGVVFIICGILLLTAGNITESAMFTNDTSTSATALALADSYKPASLKSFDMLNYMMIFDLFMFFWTTEFIQAIGVMVVGGTISHWYFGTTDTGVKPGASHHGQSHPCCCSWWIALRFHMGSAAFGSFLIALITMVRLAFEYIDHEMKKHNTGTPNIAMRALKCMVSCCLYCLNKCIRFISKNAFIHTAMKGDAFCFASVRSYHLIFNHLLAFGATNSITAILMILGKCMVCIASMLFGYSWVNYSGTYSDPTKDTYVTSSLFISLCVLMLSYLVAESFFNVFHVCIDTIMLAYCIVSILLFLFLLCSFFSFFFFLFNQSVDLFLTQILFYLSIIVLSYSCRILIHHQKVQHRVAL